MPPETESPLNTPTESHPLRVLIVEDDPMMQLGLEQSLAAHPSSPSLDKLKMDT
jgi:hypothetical protein